MALKADIEYRGIPIKGCYIKVEDFRGDKHQIEGTIHYKANRMEASFVEMLRSIPFDPNGGNPLEQFYAVLKAEIPGAVDC